MDKNMYCGVKMSNRKAPANSKLNCNQVRYYGLKQIDEDLTKQTNKNQRILPEENQRMSPEENQQISSEKKDNLNN